MALLTLLDAHLAYGEKPLLDGAGFTVEEGERIGLIGRNGTGKSTLLRVLAGLASLDDGDLKRRSGLRIALVEQEPQLPDAPTLRASLTRRAAEAAAAGGPGTAQLGAADEREGWRAGTKLTEFLHRFGLDPDVSPQNCSGGERKRAALALALALEPQLLLLDEPTNHLDIEGIERLEERLLEMPALIMITHDRAFLDRVTTRICELDRGVLRSYEGNFAAYERRKDEQLAAEQTVNRRFDKFWAQEEVWIRKGIEARRTRNEGRVLRLEQLRRERAARRDALGRVNFDVAMGERSGRRVA
ncbi:MAG TPA: ATP-binding cassette domain-containing protein, partial [Steroidobacteraceae bacterium]